MQVGVDRDELANRIHAEPGQDNRQQHRVTRAECLGGMQRFDRMDETRFERERRRGGQCGEPDAQDSYGRAQASSCDQGGVQPQQRFS